MRSMICRLALAVILAAGCSISPGTGGTASHSSATGAGGAGGASTGDGGAATTATGTGGDLPGCTPGRATADRPDDAAGYQIHVDYVLPSDGVDEQLDTNGTLETSVSAIRTWFNTVSGGLDLRFDTCGGALDVRFVQVPEAEAKLKSYGPFIRDHLEAHLQKMGLINPMKIEVVYYGGDSQGFCGNGPWPPALVGHAAVEYLKGTFADPNIPPCASNPLGASPIAPGYLEFTVLHEILHTLGITPTCAPNQIGSGHVSDSPTDLMYAGNQPWQPSVLDFNHDDYFEHGQQGCLDLAQSAFIDPLPANAQKPPGW